MNKRWIQQAHVRKGALHRQLGLPKQKHISSSTLKKILKTPVGKKIDHVKVTPLLKKRVNFAYNVRRR